MKTDNTYTQQNSPLSEAVTNIPAKFRTRIVQSYEEMKRRQAKAAYSGENDTVGLSAGKFCESVLRLLQHEILGVSTPFGTHIGNFPDECRKLISASAPTKPETLRVIIPRALVFLYTMRGKRGIGHVGGDIESESIDMATIVRISDWVMSELLRVYHDLPLEKAQALLDSLASRNLPIVWSVGGRKRVLKPGMNFKQKVLILLYSSGENSLLLEELFDWSEHPRKDNFKRDVLRPLHRDKWIEYDEADEIIYLLPPGEAEVEKNLLGGIVS